MTETFIRVIVPLHRQLSVIAGKTIHTVTVGLSDISWTVACKYFTSPRSNPIPGFAEEPQALEVSGKMFL